MSTAADFAETRPYESDRRVWGTAVFPTSGGLAFVYIVGYDRDTVCDVANQIVAHEREYPVYVNTVSEYRLGDFIAPLEAYSYAELERDGVAIL